jgi:hypothetical protein
LKNRPQKLHYETKIVKIIQLTGKGNKKMEEERKKRKKKRKLLKEFLFQCWKKGKQRRSRKKLGTSKKVLIASVGK